jgi:hypothetical protein
LGLFLKAQFFALGKKMCHTIDFVIDINHANQKIFLSLTEFKFYYTGETLKILNLNAKVCTINPITLQKPKNICLFLKLLKLG